MRLPFSKMHGLGNDFVVIDAINNPVDITPDLARFLGDRRFGVGCDQILVVDPSKSPDVDFGYRIFNADGSQVEQCGNGARCFARYVYDHGLTDKTEIAVETVSGVINPSLREDGQVRVDMGAPDFTPSSLPFVADAESDRYAIQVADQHLNIGAVSMGNPHAVLLVDDTDKAPVRTIGPELEKHDRFPERVNAGFMQIISRNQVQLRVYERGAGETLACGTGACAAVAIGRRWGLLDETVTVRLPGGRLEIEWPDSQPGAETPHVMMTGPAETVFEGWITL
ncbi:MAG: diaminopimelate epimerase [Gammaproteobacteria bacterium]